MKVVVPLLLLGILSLPFLHDHQVLPSGGVHESHASDHASLVRHVHLGENSPHFPKPESDGDESQNHWQFLKHVSLNTLGAGPTTHFSTVLHKSDSSYPDFSPPVLDQSSWQRTSPVRGSPLTNFDAFFLSSNLPPSHSGRAPPPSLV